MNAKPPLPPWTLLGRLTHRLHVEWETAWCKSDPSHGKNFFTLVEQCERSHECSPLQSAMIMTMLEVLLTKPIRRPVPIDCMHVREFERAVDVFFQTLDAAAAPSVYDMPVDVVMRFAAALPSWKDCGAGQWVGRALVEVLA
ncbi:Aste57867_13812 [Aphanomyces stellatus]|uniref:Aste57867_13812 protein n=1 Tax=Aphanomyces stellatus TaxID=120398 RepID=A0A485KZS5_9STRA|nr:hypothetical protein As57867_013762 [Aphanomyces stellatus]VFT90644.1 Aste57867_13812 [Aphanomyces stellatus]